MVRKVAVFGLVVIGLHACEILILGTSPAGSLVANLLQLFA